MHRSIRQEVSYKKCSYKFTGKQLCQSLFFNKVASLRPKTFLKKRLWHWCFPVNFAKYLRTYFLQNTSEWLLLNTTNTTDSHRFVTVIKINDGNNWKHIFVTWRKDWRFADRVPGMDAVNQEGINQVFYI